ncbi:MAG: hypothetical protein WBC21_03030 [Minisyncoccales bacterium]
MATGDVVGKDSKKTWDKWDKGESTYNPVEEALINLKEGQKLETIFHLLGSCTICPVGNTTCTDYMKIKILGFHPELPGKKHSLIICSLGVENVDDCPLNK